MFKQIIIGLIVQATNLPEKKVDETLEVPPNPKLGDYAFPCFILSDPKLYDEFWEDVEKDFFIKKSPVEIASHLKDSIETKLPKEIEKIETKGPYLNFFVNKKELAKQVIKIGANYGKAKHNEKIMVEYETPNTNKPLHLGHLRNASIGMSVSNILEFLGNKVIRADMFNNRGIHICQAMLAYERFMDKKVPDKKSDHFVGDAYVLFHEKAKENPELKQDAQEMLKKFEAGDKKTLELWKKIDKWAIDGIKETDRIFGNKFDIYLKETDFHKDAKEIVKEGLTKGAFEKDREGNIIAKIPPHPDKIIQRKDGTAIYITNDLAMTPYKFKKYDIDRSLWVVGGEQNLYFQQLFEVLKKLEYHWVDRCEHVSYGLVFLPHGKMKSREGTVVDADDFIAEMQNHAKKELEKRGKLTKKELQERSLKIALAAIKYYFLKIEKIKNMTFNPEESISFEGNTGPYLQYTYARASSIIRKSKNKSNSSKIPDLEESEEILINKIANFPETVENAGKRREPLIIANYAYDLAKSFNEFYHKCKVIGDKNESFRLKLINAFRITLKNALFLLGIEVLEEM
jgi:arginyl-tRNA synthetase